MTEVYYIEDDENIADIVKKYLEQKGFNPSIFPTIASAKCALTQHIPDILLIDWNMPDGSGDTLCQWARRKWKDLPIILITVRNDTRDIISGFDQGADDHIAKPFELEVLHARIQALLRRSKNVSGGYLSCGPISVDTDRMMVFCQGEEITVSQGEYQLLLLLMENKGKTITRERLLEQIWDQNGNYVNDNTLTVTMKRLREKLRHPPCLKTIRSFGYRMEDGT
jgi:Response regulators consisting of a CheY-like receiver domain and a winged-helix DNA-binding domain